MLPKIVLHNIVSLDGRIDGFTPDVGLFYELAGTWKEDATLAGSETILASPSAANVDDPRKVTPRASGAHDERPLLVIPDSRGRVRCWEHLLKQSYWRGGVALMSMATPPAHCEYLSKKNVVCVIAGKEQVDLKSALETLHDLYGVRTVRVDSGGVLNGILLREGLVDEISLLISPVLAGDGARALFRTVHSELPVTLTHSEKLPGGVVWVRYRVEK
ncbi:MAG TPA: RibD family protein [bacterium]|jgi:2,5-diamino-6-(ribosylamino)-4(3H)-pyrimidinone 5'-phosphate reductase